MGDLHRIVEQEVGGRRVAIIGLDGLHIDRLHQATANREEESVEFLSALSVATHRFDAIDWAYVADTIGQTLGSNPLFGRELHRRNRRIRQLIRRRLSEPGVSQLGSARHRHVARAP